MVADTRDPHGHVAEFGWRPAARGTHAEKNGNASDARVEETRAGEASVRCKRAWELLQLGPTTLRRDRLRHVAACEARSARLTARLGAGEGWLMGFRWAFLFFLFLVLAQMSYFPTKQLKLN